MLEMLPQNGGGIKMFRNSTANKVIAIVSAVVLWFYVVGSVDPTIQQKYDNIPIKLLNMDSLTSQGLAINDSDHLYIDLVVEGSRTDIKKLEQGDVKVTADLYGRHEGSNYLNIDVEVPKEIKITSKSSDKIMVTIDQRVSEMRDVEVKVKGTLEGDKILGDIKASPKQVEISGTETTLSKVNAVVANVDANKLASKGTIESAIAPIGKDGHNIDFVEISQDSVDVSASLEHTKEVNLKVKTVGEIDEQFTVRDIEIPDKIWIQGDVDVLKGITEIESRDVDISGVTKSTNLKIYPILPTGVTVSSKSENIAVKVILEDQESREFVYTSDEIEVENVAEGLTVESVGAVTVTVYGNSDSVQAMTKGMIKVFVDLDGFEEGTHKINAEVKTYTDNITTRVYPAKVKVVLK